MALLPGIARHFLSEEGRCVPVGLSAKKVLRTRALLRVRISDLRSATTPRDKKMHYGRAFRAVHNDALVSPWIMLKCRGSWLTRKPHHIERKLFYVVDQTMYRFLCCLRIAFGNRRCDGAMEASHSWYISVFIIVKQPETA